MAFIQHGDPTQPVRIRVDGRSVGDVSVVVSNRGQPIPANILPHIFDPFRSGAALNERVRGSGLGLGLFIAQEITRSHGGRIEVSSKDDETRFTVSLPRVPTVSRSLSTTT